MLIIKAVRLAHSRHSLCLYRKKIIQIFEQIKSGKKERYVYF